MNINRHNYEEFFLLYVDKELSAAERKTVEVFVQENPDLQVELLALQQTVLKADDEVLEKKDWLYMEDGVSALQENLLLYADDELSAADIKTVEALLATDKAAATEWNILRQTKLQPETSVVFEDKNSLYRTEGGRVVGIKWWRVAAAAVLLGFGLWTGVVLYKNNFRTTTGGTEVAGTGKANTGQSTAEAIPGKNGNTPQASMGSDRASQNTTTVSVANNPNQQPVVTPAQQTQTTVDKITNDQKNNVAVKVKGDKKQDNNLPKPNFENINRNERNEYAVTNVTNENNNINTSGVNGVVVKTNPVITDPATTTAVPVAYNEENNNNDRFLYMDEDKVKRTKLGGFIRKAKRVLERNANIKTGDGLKVAGFEIALK